MKCVICNKGGEVHHIISRGACGRDKKIYDVKENRVPLCRQHHSEVHFIGAKSFWEKYNMFDRYVEAKTKIRDAEKGKYEKC